MNKYVELALSMAKTRSDWSQSFYRVKDALNNFKVETELDQKIYDDIIDILNDEDITDGRVFRDCDYSYDWIRENILSSEENALYAKLLKEYYDEF